MSEKVLSKVNNDIFSYDTTGGVFKMSRVMPTEIHHTQAGVGPDGYILTSTGPNGNGWTWTDPSVIETPLQVLNLPVTDPKTYSTGADGYVLISKGSTDPPLWTNEISIHKVSATNFQCGSRNIVDASAGCSFTALEIKPSTSGATETLLIDSNGDITCHGTLSIDSISEKSSGSGITLNSAVKMTNIQSSTNANKLLYNDTTGEITYQPDSGSGGTEIVGTSLRSTLTGNNVNSSLSISLGEQAGNSGQQEKTIAIGNYAAYQNQALFGIAIGVTAGQSSQNQYAIAFGWGAGTWSQGESCIAIGKAAGNDRQESGAISIGDTAGKSLQGIEAIAIGTLAGENDQDSFAIAIGPAAGRYNAQGDSAVAIGHNAGNDNQGNYTVALGTHSATNNQADGAVSVGDSAGRFDQQYGGVSVGRFAGHSNQHNSATALGNSSGFSWQKQQAVAIGHQGGCYNQNEYSVAIGAYTGWNNQSWKATALGVEAGKNNQGSQTVAIGDAAGRDNQGEGSIAIGNAAGLDYQGTNCIAIGRNAGRLNDQGNEAVAIGNSAGYDNQKERNIAIGSYAQSNTQIGSQSIAIGYKAGQTSQGGECVAIGFDAGNLNQGNSSVAIGYEAGKNNQKFLCTAIGTFSGKSNQNEYGVALGVYAGQTDQGVFCTAVGPAAGQNQQGIHSVAIGHNAGHLALGDWSVAIGPAAGFLNPNGLTNYIVINAQNTNLDPASSNGFHVKPINSASNSNKLLYNSDTGEITYQPDSAGSIIALNDLTNEITLGNSSNTLFRIPGLGGSNGNVLTYNNGYIEFGAVAHANTAAQLQTGRYIGGKYFRGNADINLHESEVCQDTFFRYADRIGYAQVGLMSTSNRANVYSNTRALTFWDTRGWYNFPTFTGTHICFGNFNSTDIGLIVSANGKFINQDNSLKPSIEESLPILELSNKNNDKRVFGVINKKEEEERHYRIGSTIFPFTKENNNEYRFIINSLGEGAIWVCNKNGILENGDYITTSNIIGYGQKQNDDLLHNYTVAKITNGCNFSLTKIIKQKLKIEVLQDNSGNNYNNILYTNNNEFQYEYDLDESGNIIYNYEYDTRFLDENSNILSGEEEYLSRLNNGENVFIACFVGCTYHCG